MVLVMEEVKEVAQVVVVLMAIQEAEEMLDMALITEEWEVVVMEEGEEALVMVSNKEEVRRKLKVKVMIEEENMSIVGVANLVVADKLLEVVKVA